MIGDRIDLSRPPDFGGRTITAIHLHHDGGGTELDDARDVEEDALSRTDERFAAIPYNIVIYRPLAPDPPTLGVNYWIAVEGRPLEVMPASIGGHNTGAVAIVVAGRWDRDPLPLFALERIAEVCVWVCRAAGLGAEAIFGHRELANTLCPGYDPELVRQAVRDRL